MDVARVSRASLRGATAGSEPAFADVREAPLVWLRSERHVADVSGNAVTTASPAAGTSRYALCCAQCDNCNEDLDDRFACEQATTTTRPSTTTSSTTTTTSTTSTTTP